jgi:uncharacterized membrane protein YraQ (UPF0718 family)
LFAFLLYGFAATLVLLSARKDKQKTIAALKKSWRAFENILPIFLTILVLIGLSLAIVSPEMILKMLGKDSGWLGISTAAFIGSFTLLPGFVTFPLAATLLESGAGVTQVIVFISTSMMVSILTLPAEIQCFDKKIAITRNILALLFSAVVAVLLKAVMEW